MQIIIPPKQFTQGEVGRAIEWELRTGLLHKKATEQKRENQAAEEAKMIAGHKAFGPNNMRAVAVIPEWEFFRMRQKYGAEVNSREFVKYFQKKNPHLSPNKL